MTLSTTVAAWAACVTIGLLFVGCVAHHVMTVRELDR